MKKENILVSIMIAAIFCVIYAIVLNVLELPAPLWVGIIVGVMSGIVSYLIVIETRRQKPRILFCDLDGTLIKTKSGKTFPEDCNDWEFRMEVLDAIRIYAPTAIHIISNQGGIEKGFVDRGEFTGKARTIIDAIFLDLDIKTSLHFTESNDPDDPYRKPNPGMIIDYLKDKGVSARHCLMIGDASGLPGQFSDSDLRCAENAHVEYMDVGDFVDRYFPGNTCI